MFEHPSLRLRVTEKQRDRALAYLQDAYAEGRLDEFEFEDRMGQALAATNRKELNAAFRGLVHIPISSAAVQTRPAGQPQLRESLGATPHFLALVSGPIGPAVCYGIAPAGSRLRAEAAKSLNYQIILLIVWAVGFAFLGGLGMALWHLALSAAFFLLHLINGVKAIGGGPTYFPGQSLKFVPTGEKRKELPRR